MQKTTRAALATAILLTCACAGARAADRGWKPARTVKLDGGLSVTLSEPVRVAQSRGFLWFPTLVKLDDRRLVAVMSDKPDAHTNEQTAEIAWSADGGLTWGATQQAPIYSECPLKVAGGHVLLPNYLFPQGGDNAVLGAPYLFCPDGKSEVVRVAEPLTVTGWPRKPGKLGAFYGHPELNVGGFVFNGQCVTLKDGRQLATLYGRYEGSRRYSLVVASSNDGRRWEYASSVADETSTIPGGEGPCEAALCRLKDGRLTCVFRVESGKPYGRSFSRDEGRTWGEPDTIAAGSVQPSMVVLPDGVVALSGGRPGASVWFDVAGDGQRWQSVELLGAAEKTSSYTELVALDDRNVLCVYDRIPHGWNAIPPDSKDVNSVWVVRLTLER
jgi:hypothetical protein